VCCSRTDKCRIAVLQTDREIDVEIDGRGNTMERDVDAIATPMNRGGIDGRMRGTMAVEETHAEELSCHRKKEPVVVIGSEYTVLVPLSTPEPCGTPEQLFLGFFCIWQGDIMMEREATQGRAREVTGPAKKVMGGGCARGRVPWTNSWVMEAAGRKLVL
jgi:hypothetical protein